MIDVLDLDKLANFSKDELELKLSRNAIGSLEFLLEITNNGVLLYSNELVMQHQSTNYDSYQFIMKDFIADVNKSSELIVNSIINIYCECSELIKEEPSIVGHSIRYNKETNKIESLTIKNHYINYMNYVLKKGILVSKFLHEINSPFTTTFDNILEFKYDEAGQVIYFNEDNLFTNKYQSKRVALLFDDSHKIEVALRQNKDIIESETFEALNYFKSSKEERSYCSKEMRYSLNLWDEKIINKKDQYFNLVYDDIEFDFIGNDIINENRKSTQWTYRFKSDFDVSYYIKKYLIESYTNIDMFTYMCIYKDFLSNYVLNNFKNTDDYNQNHPMTKEAILVNEIDNETAKYNKRLKYYLEKIDEVRNDSKDCLIITRAIREWLDILQLPEQTKKYFINKFQSNKEPTIEEIVAALQEYGNKTLESLKLRILDTDEKKETYDTIQKANKLLENSIYNLYNKLYNIDNFESNNTIFDATRLFKKRDRASFHTTLKDSIVIDCRGEESKANTNENKHINEEKIVEITTILKNHKYHDYIEIDSDLFKEGNYINTIEDIIFFLEKTNKFDIPVKQKCAMKFRKLGNYKANGIYFSFSKQLGVDYRKGVSSYIHELAHHIDLNTNNSNRKNILKILMNYFNNRIGERREYYLKSEELIARAAEISMVLLLGRYNQYKEFYDKNEIDEDTLIKAIKEAFEKSKYRNYMKTFVEYKSEEYIDIENEIFNRNFYLIDTLLVYFKAFWSGKDLNSKDEKKLSSNINISFENENNFSKKNEYSYTYHYKSMFKGKIYL